ncbi:MAG: hypothetical protein IT315_06770 [Anaerolineales bacterium]|nr:hypothetical protein [Anaerolineales bacterium]
MYQVNNTPPGKFQVYDGKKWVDVSIAQFAQILRDNSSRPLDQYHAIVFAGVNGVPAGMDAQVGMYLCRFWAF